MRGSLVLGAAAATLALLSGCGGSSSKTTTTHASATQGAATSASQSTTASGRGYGGSAGSSGSAAGAGAVLVTTKHSKLGTILAAGPKRLTVYLFEGDRGTGSNCTGACASAWPPVTSAAGASAAGAAVAADLGTIKRADGGTQVTYKGHPLYFFATDKDQGDAYGQGVKAFGADWYVLGSSGKKVDNS